MKPIQNISPTRLPSNIQEYLSMQNIWVRANNIVEGSRVRITRIAKGHAHGWVNSWVDEMDCTVGRIFEVKTNTEPHNLSTLGIHLSCHFSYPFFILKKVD